MFTQPEGTIIKYLIYANLRNNVVSERKKNQN